MFEKPSLKDRILSRLKRRRKPLVILMVLVLLGSIGAAIAKIYWTRTVSYQVNVQGIVGELLGTTYEAYDQKQIATSLDAQNRISVVIYFENYANDVWLNCSVSGAPQGLVASFSGQYWLCHEFAGWKYEPTGSAFDVTGYHVIDKTLMLWGHPGGALVVTFVWDGGTANPGTYPLTILFQMGFV